MPELPEVETIKRDLAKKIVGLSISKVDVFDDRVVKNFSARQIKSRLSNQTIKGVNRRGKTLIVEFNSGSYLLVQPKMTGQLIYSSTPKLLDRPVDTKVTFHLSNGQYLTYNDQRLFGWLIFTKKLDNISFLNSLGPEPLAQEFNAPWLSESIKTRKAPIKTLLMNQAFVAGIGNIYASEILFRARINPKKEANKLNEHEVNLLVDSTRSILKEAIKLRGSSMRNYRDASGKKGTFKNRIKVYARESQSCVACKKDICRIVQAGRSTFYCQQCQV